LEQRVKGVFGSGKTTVLAARAVQAYKRALARNNAPRILILTFNITLKNFIHDKLMRVDETFPLESFIIINYHQFINAELNNLNIDVVVPENYPKEKVGEYLEQNFYSNISLFEDNKAGIVKYDAVLIDEIQDYHRPWMEIIKNYFRDPQGDYVLFGDVKQNIYGQPTSQKDVVTNVRGVNELKYCFRSDFKVRDLAQSFQSTIFRDKYDIDDFSENGTWNFFGQEQQKEGLINYMYLSNTDSVVALYNIIRGNIINNANKISPNDITILGYTASQLRLFDCYYRYASRERTNSMLETIEAMYMTHLNFLGKDMENAGGWFKSISGHLSKKLFPKRNVLFENDIIKLRQHIAKLFTIYDLYSSYSDTFINRLKEECEVCGISTDAFFAFLRHYEDELTPFKTMVYNSSYKNIRDNKKLHFWMNSGTIKISTINSFKGWESEVVFLIIEPKYDRTTSFNLWFDELLYTGLTRCKRNLIVVNFGNTEYDQKIRPLIDRLK
jgi:superfamily I DNA/RNA helicase